MSSKARGYCQSFQQPIAGTDFWKCERLQASQMDVLGSQSIAVSIGRAKAKGMSEYEHKVAERRETCTTKTEKA
eukprot:12802-Pelagomonas_calceolata.AAC.1